MPDEPLSDATVRFGKNLQRARQELGATQREFAHAAQIDESTYRKIELGYRNPSLHNLIRIVDTMGLDWNELMQGLDAGMVPPPRIRTAAARSMDELRQDRDQKRRRKR